MYSVEAPFTPAERQKMEELVDRSYQLFLERVAGARRRPAAEIEAVAGGRVWTGAQARERGLVDELDGLQGALREARRLAGLPADAQVRDVRHGNRELVPPVALTPAALEHAL